MLNRILLLFFLFIIVTGLKPDNQPLQLYFEKFAFSDKLPSSSVIRIFNDKEGYLWFGTQDGLCRFDGYNVKVFRSSALTPGRLTNNQIQCIAEDNYNNIWVGTTEGVNIIDKNNFTIKALNNEYIKKERINSILNDSKGFIWIATSNKGAICIDPKTGSYTRYSTDNPQSQRTNSNNVIQIFEDQKGRIWLTQWKNGLCYITPDRSHIFHAPVVGKNNNPFRLFQDKDSLYWICTWGDGMFHMKIDSSGKINISPIPLSKKSDKKPDDIIYSITQDNKYGNIWIVSFNGLYTISKEPDGTYKITDGAAYFGETTNKLFHEIVKDHWGNLWIGSVGEGVYNLDFNRLAIQNFPLNEIKSTLGVPSYITRLCEHPNGDVYLVINRIGLFKFNPVNGNIVRPSDANTRSIRSITTIQYIKGSNEIWLANEGEDLVRIFRDQGKNDLVQLNSFSLSNSNPPRENNISAIFEDSKKDVWIGSTQGLYIKPLNEPVSLRAQDIFNINTINEDVNKNIWVGTDKDGVFIGKPRSKGKDITYTFSKIKLSIGNFQSLSIQSICCKKNGDVYLGTKEGCLYYYNPATKAASDISGLYGITDEGIIDILEDDFGMLWLTTIKRIIRYNPQTHTATYYSSSDGMLLSMFFKGAKVKLANGRILYGGNKGICMFDPSTIVKSSSVQKKRVYITDILVQNKSIFDDTVSLHYNSEKNRITLQNTENNLNIEFSALNYPSANKIQYAYMLSGADNDWVYVGNNRHFVNYTNLPAGKYEFQIKASDENGLWSDQITSLDIQIEPPPYKTWWAYIIYIIIIASATYFVARMVINRIRLRNELKISHIEKEKSEELAQIKLRYFTNISHELLTPLTIILLLIERLHKQNSADSYHFDMLKTNAIRLKRLIQQILVFRKTESGNIKLKISQNDIIAFVNNICHSNFQPLITEKNIKFALIADTENYLAWFDPDKLDKVLYNLLSNAFKYTPRGGEISVKISFMSRSKDTIMRLSVSDTGTGISEDDLPHIFKRFFTSSKSDPSQSHGIGLSLTSDLLQLHKGNIEVKSKLGEGTVFTIEIPVSKESYNADDFSEEENVQPIDIPEISDIIPSDSSEEYQEKLTSHEDYTILVVEDNRELKNLIADNLSRKYDVLSAENGKEALDIIREKEVDLIISDVMMPEMDGLTFCRIVKNDIVTSHINVLMLTAKNSTEDRIECYNAGADGFIAKPFELRLLLARTKNLIGKRTQKTESFQKNQEINISEMEYSSIDEDFLKHAVQKVEARLSDITFDFDQFALDLGTSKSTLHRKLKSLTGLAPGEFIRNIRLKHASKMILSNTGNISDIAYAVGFNDPKYFTKCFKSEFGLTPTEYLESKK